MKFTDSSINRLFHLTAIGLLILLTGFVWMFISAPAYASAPGCQIFFPTGSDITDANIDGSLGADWSDANIVQTGSPCMATFFGDWNGSLQASGHAVPALQKIVKIYTKQSANNFYMAFEVLDQTQQPLLNGEKIILQLDPSMSPGGNQLSSDYRIEITHKWSPATLTKKLFDSGTPAGSSICNQQDWHEISSNPAIPVGLGVTGANQNPSSKYTIEVKIPRNLIGNPGLQNNFGIAFAVINDLGNGNTGDATGIAFPTSLPLINAMNGILPDSLNPTGCGDWLIPDKWGMGGLAFLGDVTISTNPIWWNSLDITALACNNPSYEYYPTKPCKLTLQATLHNSSAVDQTRNVLFMWADHGSSPSTWRVIGIKEGVVIPQNGSTPVLSDQWSGVPLNLPNHPCVRAYILPPTYLAAFDKSAILGITNATQLQNMMTAYTFGAPPNPRWAQKNISQHTGGGSCPDQSCDIGSLELRPAVANQVIGVSLLSDARASDTGSDKQPGLFLSDEERARFSKDVMVQVRAFGYSKSQGKYNFIEDLGGVMQVVPVNLIQKDGKVPLQLNVTNPGNVARTIFLHVDIYTPPGQENITITGIETGPQNYGPDETRVVKGTVAPKAGTPSIPRWVWLLLALIIVLLLVWLLAKKK